MNYIKELERLEACPEAIEWARDYKTFKEAWEACERADWMLWIAGELANENGNKKEVVLCACEIARTALKYLPKDKDYSLKCIRTVERWVKGKATIEDVRKSRSVAYVAYSSYSHDYVAYAAYSAYSAYYSADSAAYAADAVGYSSYSAYYAADAVGYAAYLAYSDDAAAASTRYKTLKELANMIRDNLKVPIL